jgi:PAS domain S-box-containing protein
MNQLSCDHVLKLFMEAYPGIVAYIDRNYRYQFLSPSYEEWFGITLSEIRGKTIEEFVGQEKFKLRRPYLDRVLKGEEVKFNAFFDHASLGPIEVEQIYRPDFDSEGKVQGFLAIAHDITEQKRNERLALEKDARFRSLRDLVPQMIWEADTEGNIVWFNKGLIDITGASYEENLGQGWIKYLHPDDIAPTLKNWEKALSETSTLSTEYRVRTQSGEYRWFKVLASPVLDEANLVMGWVGTATDIEEEKAAKEIAESERKKIYSLLMQAPIGILVTNGPDHIIDLQNESARRLVKGLDLTGRSIKDLLLLLNLNDVKKVMDKIYQNGQGERFYSVPLKYKSSKENDDIFYVDITFEPLFGETGRPVGIFCMGRDVTTEVMAKHQARENEIIFKNYVESMPQIAFITDAHGRIMYFNQQWRNFSGYDEENHERWNSQAFIHPDDHLEAQERWLHSIMTGHPFEIKYRLRRKDGVYRWHLGRSLPLRDSHGRVTKWVGTDTDIHDQKEIEVNQGRLLQLMDSSSDFIGMTDRFGKIIHINTAGKRILGLNEGENPLDFKLNDFIFPEDINFVEKIILPTTLRSGKWVGEFRFRHLQTQKEVWMHYNAFTTQDEKSGEITGFAAVSRDITELKKKEKKLEEALKARDQFLSMASHELKTPLTSMKLQAQLNLRNLRAQKEISLERQVALAHQTNQLVGRLTKLIDDMLDVSRIRTGKLRLERSQEEIGDIVREVILRMSVLFEALDLPIPPIELEEKIFGFWDRFRIEQVIGNLLTNAIRYGKGNPIELKVRREDEHVFVSVKDKGYGIPEQDLSRIFDRFERASHSSEVSGLGLGLFISREIVAAHGGQILVESKVDHGSTFHVCLPLKIPTSQL